MVITLAIHFVGIGAVVAQPSAVEASFLPPRDMMLELSNSTFQCRECLREPCVDFWAGCRELGEHGPKLPLNSGTENSISSNTAVVPIAPPREQLRDENPDEGYQCDGYCGLYLSLPMWIAAYWNSLHSLFRRDKPNVELRGAGND